MEPHAHTSSLSATAVAILLLAGGLLTVSSGTTGNSRPATGKNTAPSPSSHSRILSALRHRCR